MLTTGFRNLGERTRNSQPKSCPTVHFPCHFPCTEKLSGSTPISRESRSKTSRSIRHPAKSRLVTLELVNTAPSKFASLNATLSRVDPEKSAPEKFPCIQKQFVIVD